MAVKGIKDWIMGNDMDENSEFNSAEYEDEFMSASSSLFENNGEPSKVKPEADFANKSSQMVVFEPRAYSESQQIADYLKKRNTVVVNLKRVTPDQGKRIIDFVSGCLYAIGGTMQKLGDGIFLCAPKNINVQGKMTEEEEPKRGRTKNISEDF